MSNAPATPEKKGFSERFRSKPENAAKAAAETAARSRARIGLSVQPYIKLHIPQLLRLIEMNDPIAFMLFVILLGECFASRGQPFELPTSALLQIRGLGRGNEKRLRAKLRKLEQWNLISIVAQGAPKPILIKVPLSLSLLGSI